MDHDDNQDVFSEATEEETRSNVTEVEANSCDSQ